MEMTRQRHTESVRAAVYDDCPVLHWPRQGEEFIDHERGNPAAKLAEILKSARATSRISNCASWFTPTVLERLRKEDEKLLIEMEKRYFGKAVVPGGTGLPRRAVQRSSTWTTNEEMASIGS